MVRVKAFRYRIYPTVQQRARLARWESALRWLWNLANEQRLMGLARPKGEKVYANYYSQQRELTDLRAELPWLADVPTDLLQACLKDLDTAWQRCFDKKLPQFRRPRFKSRARDQRPALRCAAPKRFRLDADGLRQFPKLGAVRTVMHRPIEGKPKTCSLVREGDQWFVAVVCDVECTEPKRRTDHPVGIDRGINALFVTSYGRLAPNPKFYERGMDRLARAQRIVSRRQKGSRRREKAKERVMRLHRKVRRQRNHVLHVESANLAKNHGIVVLEDLNVKGMVRGRLGRSISDAGWSKFGEMLRYKLRWSGGTLLEVPAHHTSQTCSSCDHVDPASRKGTKFRCTACGFEIHADLNGAINIKRRGNPSVLRVDGSLPVGPGRSAKVSVSRRQRASAHLQSPVL